jgi:hypothetical protein
LVPTGKHFQAERKREIFAIALEKNCFFFFFLFNKNRVNYVCNMISDMQKALAIKIPSSSAD